MWIQQVLQLLCGNGQVFSLLVANRYKTTEFRVQIWETEIAFPWTTSLKLVKTEFYLLSDMFDHGTRGMALYNYSCTGVYIYL